MRHHIGQFGRRHAMGEAHQIGARHIHVDQHARHLQRRHGHGLGGNLRVNMIARNESVDHVEVARLTAIHRSHSAVAEHKSRSRIMRALERCEAMIGVFGRELIEPQGPFVPIGKPFPAIGGRGQGIGHEGWSVVQDQSMGARPTISLAQWWRF